MEKQKILRPTITSNVIGKDNVIGSVMKRKRLSDITNTVSSSTPAMSGAQFQENVKEISCGITKDYISQLMEENATLLKALGERNKVIELISIELQKLQLAWENGSQQNRQLALTNSQMLAELNLSKERVKALQHELGCSVAVIRLKNSELDEKEELNKELCVKIRAKVDLPKLAEVTTDAMKADSTGTRSGSVRNQNSTSLALQVQAEKKRKVFHEKSRAEETASRHVEFATNMTQLHSVTNNMANRPDGNSELHKLNGDVCEKISSEEQPNCVEAATVASQAHAVDTNMPIKPNRKHSLRNQTTCSVNLRPQVEAKEKDDRTRRKSSRRKSSNVEREPCKSKDYLFEIVDADIPAYSSLSELPNERKPIQLESSALSSSIACCKHGEDVTQNDRSSSSQDQTQGPWKISVGRPMRKAAEKVSSYKEIPLTAKMRRHE